MFNIKSTLPRFLLTRITGSGFGLLPLQAATMMAKGGRVDWPNELEAIARLYYRTVTNLHTLLTKIKQNNLGGLF